MDNLEIPLRNKTKLYRFFEMVPAFLSYGAILLLVVLSILNPLLAAIYLLLIIVTMIVKSAVIAVHTIQGYHRLRGAERVDWHQRLNDLEDPKAALAKSSQKSLKKEFQGLEHIRNLEYIAAIQTVFPRPSQVYNAVIVAAYNESYEVVKPTIDSIAATAYPNDHLIVVFAYEERGGEAIEKTAYRLQEEFKDVFFKFAIVKHPKDLPNEVIGKGGNITYAGRWLQKYLDKAGILYKNVLVTTLDSDNKPHKAYFDSATYEFIVRDDRKHFSYQPVSLFLNNIWDVPAPMRVIATGNSFWNIISSMRPHTLRNFASHSQPMDALVEMDFWSTRTIVEDGHQYWRSWFYFRGRYDVLPLYIPIYQDAVIAETYRKTLVAQFVQLRRWAYGVSDIPYVATLIFTKNRRVSFTSGFVRLVRLIDGHLTLACISILVAFGGWVPLLLNSESSRSIAAHQLPNVISAIQQVAMIGIFITVLLSLKLLPPRPERYKRTRTFWMVAQWVLMPVTSVIYNSFAAYYSQTRLLLGKYLTKFDVTKKMAVPKDPK